MWLRFTNTFSKDVFNEAKPSVGSNPTNLTWEPPAQTSLWGRENVSQSWWGIFFKENSPVLGHRVKTELPIISICYHLTCNLLSSSVGKSGGKKN